MIPIKVRQIAWPFLLPRYLAASHPEKTLSQTCSKSRQQAEIAFSHAQSQFFARNNSVNELDSLARSSQERTLRLREARLAKEVQDRAAATPSLLPKRHQDDLTTPVMDGGARERKGEQFRYNLTHIVHV
ncbi:hypothetical protein [Pseudaminobacter soli (ex Zhang et al. 2022)]|uniref:hypothetical protein n=1 Tax=Pseudaminobacter soli (ex Zhang et al. 2022) TaxID=2831468 RepID=UPI003CC7E525